MTKKIFILLITIIGLTACENPRLDMNMMPRAPKKGPPEYIQGWKEGCQTGMTAYGSDYMRMRYHTNVNPYMMRNPRYNKGWELGQRYCSYYVSTYMSNKEMHKDDKRMDNTWLTAKSDGFFSYNFGW